MENAARLPRSLAWPRLPGGLSISGALSLLAVVAVLVVVSVPRLRCMALDENEVDARATAEILARSLRALEASGTRPGGGRSPVTLKELLRRSDLQGHLTDAEVLEGGLLLRRRGYLFEVTQLSPGLSLPGATSAVLGGGKGTVRTVPAVRAWPWAYEGTGRSSFLALPGGAILVHANPGGRWQGAASARTSLGVLDGWRAVN